MNAANIAAPTFFDDEEIRPQFASAAVVYVPESHDPQRREIEAWARPEVAGGTELGAIAPLFAKLEPEALSE